MILIEIMILYLKFHNVIGCAVDEEVLESAGKCIVCQNSSNYIYVYFYFIPAIDKHISKFC